MRCLIHVIFNVCINYEVSIFNYFKILRGPQISIFIDSICIAHVRYWYHAIHKQSVKSNLIFVFFSIQYATFTELSLTIRGVPYLPQC